MEMVSGSVVSNLEEGKTAVLDKEEPKGPKSVFWRGHKTNLISHPSEDGARPM